MTKQIITLSIITLVIATLGCNRKPKTEKAQISYTIGAQFGKSLRSQNLDLDADIVARGIVDAVEGDKLKLSDDEMQSSMMKLAENKQKEIKEQSETNKKKSEEFLSSNKLNADIKTTPSGLQYKITEPGSGPSPTVDQSVVVNYKGTLIDGTEFDSSYKRNQPAEFPVRGVIPGWIEGLQMMKKGGKWTFYVPPELAYGDRPRQNIPASSVLIFEVELLDIKAAPKPAITRPPSGPNAGKK